MFNLSGMPESFFGDRMAGVCQSITSALAFAHGLEKSRISAAAENETIYLEGTADSIEAIDIAINLASSISGCRILSHVEPVRFS
jgi:osmotically-inducible protein OsmY